MKRDKFSNTKSKVDITFHEETIVHAIFAEQHIASAHDSLVDYKDNEKYENFKESIWNNGKRFLISDDIVMNCFYSIVCGF
jgi:adenine specific DNA methylase Mod